MGSALQALATPEKGSAASMASMGSIFVRVFINLSLLLLSFYRSASDGWAGVGRIFPVPASIKLSRDK